MQLIRHKLQATTPLELFSHDAKGRFGKRWICDEDNIVEVCEYPDGAQSTLACVFVKSSLSTLQSRPEAVGKESWGESIALLDTFITRNPPVAPKPAPVEVLAGA